MKAKSIKGLSANEIQSELRLSMADGFKPTLAIIFISIKQDRKAVCEILCNENINVFGATSCGEFVNGHQTEGGIVVLLMDIGTTSFHILYEDIGERTIAETAQALAKDALQKFNNPSLIVCSTGVNSKGDFFDGDALVSALEKNLGNDKIFFGGMAGDDVAFTGSYVFTNEKETDHGIIAIVMDAGKISLHGMAITGWKPMGIERTVTKSAGMLLYEIDNKPAVEMYMKYLGKSEKISDKDFDVMNELSLAFPFIAERGDGETIIISPRKIDHEANALVMDVEFAEGSRFWFSCPPDFEIADEILKEANEVKQEAKTNADALLIFSCAGRPPVLGPLVKEENDGLANVWQSPMAGFFTYGEFGRAKGGKQYFHSGACCWVALKEK